MMPDEPIPSNCSHRQQQRMVDEMGSMRDDMQGLTATVMRLDGTVGRALTEVLAIHIKPQRRIQTIATRMAAQTHEA